MKNLSSNQSIKITSILWWLITVTIIVWSIYMFIDGKGTKAFMGLLTILSLVVIGLWQKKSRKSFPPLFASMTYTFIFVSVGLGTFGGFYSINHFDDFLHVTSGIWIGYGSWIVMGYLLGQEVEKLPKSFISLYIIMFALAVAGLWELLEFAGDKLFHFTAQGRDPDDTMIDMIDGLIGGAIAAIFIVRKHGLENK